jgi:PhzF family phenazine biosynthesis protein
VGPPAEESSPGADLTWVDVFATGPMTGNPLAVVWDAEGWDAPRMQAVAAELGLSETVYALAPESPEADARLRIFTPSSELPVAGHPVVGAAWALRRAGRMGDAGTVETGAGPLSVRASDGGASMDQPEPVGGILVDSAEAAAACGVVVAGWPPARVWSTGLAQLMLPAADVAALEGARPDLAAVERLGARDGWVGVSLYALLEARDGRADVRVRHFAPALGVPEDPVTGSAAGALGACLADAGMAAGGALALRVSQGTEMGRAGVVEVTVHAAGGVPRLVEVGGAVVPVIEGWILPG